MDIETTAIIQARMGSARLPGKVLLEVEGKPLICYLLERVAAAKSIGKVIVATSTEPMDDPIAKLCKEKNVACYRGNHEDVLDRYYQAARQFKLERIVRLTADCPLIDPKIIDSLVSVYIKGDYDYVANTTPPKWTFPIGMDVEVFSFNALERAWHDEKDPDQREHVTFHLWKNPNKFSLFRVDLEVDLSKYRLAVDYPNDFEIVKLILKNLYHENPLFTMEDIIEFLKSDPKISKMNTDLKWGWRTAYKNEI